MKFANLVLVGIFIVLTHGCKCESSPESKPKLEQSIPRAQEGEELELKPTMQVEGVFRIEVGGCGDNPDIADDFNYHTGKNQKIAEAYGLKIEVDKESKRCGYTLIKSTEKFEMDWGPADFFWPKFKEFFGIKE